MSGMVDPGASAGPRLTFDTGGMRCECGGLGTVTDARKMGDGWCLAIWTTAHRRGCGGLAAPERAFLLSEDAFGAGDYALPGVDPEHMRRRRP